MKNIKRIAFALMLASSSTKAQNIIPIPPIITGTTIDLMLQSGTTSFYSGFNTATNGYNGNYLGPTIVLQKGQTVNFNVMNMLNEGTSTHWHGLHVAPMNDGSPHNPIAIGATWSPSFTVMDNAATYWYHPHLHGSTMKQAIKGAAGFIIVQDPIESALTLPRTYGVDDIPLVFQFETFNTTTKEIVINDELDNAVLVNGVVANATVNLPAQMVRLRLLNASSHRFFDFGFNDNRSFSQITSDDGLLNTPVPMTRLVLSPGERAEIIVNFSGQQGSTFYLNQNGTQLPAGYPGGPLGGMGGTLGPLDNTNFALLQINVTAPTANPVTTIPTTLTTNTVLSEVGSTSRTIAITGSPMMSMTNFLMNGVQYNPNVINFTTVQDNVEVWNITNNSMMPHPFHIHGNHFYVLKVNGATPALNMQGRKDVITVPPNGGSVKLITQYKDFHDDMMPYMYHCHILSHEDNGMMGQFIVNPNPLNTNEITIKDGVEIYPNPINNSQLLNIKSDTNLQSVQFYDVLGRLVLSQNLENKLEAVAVPNLSGIYMLIIESNNKRITQKIVVH
jgi:bilirubin oxidase